MKLFNSKSTVSTLIILLMLAVFISTGISTVSAQTGTNSLNSPLSAPTSYTPLAPLPDVTSSNLQLQTSVNFSSYVTYAFNLLIALGAVAAVFMITWGGFEYMTTDAVNGKKDGLTKIQNAIYGLLLILSSYLILRTIDPRFVNISSTLVPPLTVKEGSNSSFNSFLSSVATEMNAYNADQTAARQTLATAYAQETQLQATGNTLANNIATLAGVNNDPDSISVACVSNDSSDTPNQQLSDACDAYLDNQDQLASTTSSTNLFASEKIIDGYLAACGTTGNTNSAVTNSSNGNCYTNNLQAMASYYAQNSSGLQPNDQVTLGNYANMSYDLLSMDQAFAVYNQQPKYEYSVQQSARTDALTTINTILQNASQNVTNPTMYQQLVTQATALKNKIGTN